MVEPWPVHRARTARRWFVALIVVGPLLATAAAWWGLSDQGEKSVIQTQGLNDDRQLNVKATALTVEPNLGEMTMRMVFTPLNDLVDGDQLTDEVTLFINDTSSRERRTFPAGSVMESINVVIPLEGASTRYPFDRYAGQINVGAVVDDEGGPEELTTDLEVTAALPEFAMSADSTTQDNSIKVDFDLGRRWAAITWVVMFMVIAWAIALSCAGVMWWIVVFNAATPLWVYALFASVLFALPTLRIGLPGDPRYGVLVDWASFYWAITIVAFSLVAVLTVWNISARSSFRDALARTQGEPDA